jgi:hypothetical protein
MLRIFQLWFEKNNISAAEINYVGAVYAERNISYATN